MDMEECQSDTRMLGGCMAWHLGQGVSVAALLGQHSWQSEPCCCINLVDIREDRVSVKFVVVVLEKNFNI